MEIFGRWYIRVFGFSMIICLILVSIFGKEMQPEGILAMISLVLGIIFSVLSFTKRESRGKM